MMNLTDIILLSVPFYSEKWKSVYGFFLQKRYLVSFSERLSLYDKGNLINHTLPYFEEETTPPISEVFSCFSKLMNDLRLNDLPTDNECAELWAKAIENTPFEYLLIVLGQRFTSASIKDQTALPPSDIELIASCFIPYNEQIMMATRAWEKHIGRSTDQFWGIVWGKPEYKNEKVKELITNMITNKTWWNVFFHYKHGLVYEIRVSSGHGIRWNRDGTRLIGFLEPFL